MPRKTKEQKELEKETNLKKVPTKKTTTTAKKSTTQTTPSTTKKTIEKKKSSAPKKVEKKEVSTKKKTAKKVTTKKTTTKKSTSTKKATSTRKKKVEIVEYYDLPYRYNQTVVKVLAQTPTNLFIYWDISDKDRKNFEKQYGDQFFQTTKPVLILYNDTLGYHFEVEINDFANSWYLQVADSKCDYRIELGRRPIVKTELLTENYIYVTTSNEIESPNDRVLLDPNQKMIYFRNTKTGEKTHKTLASISFLRNMGKFNTIYDFYKVLYQDEKVEEIFDLSNPSSGNPSSGSFSSQFK